MKRHIASVSFTIDASVINDLVYEYMLENLPMKAIDLLKDTGLDSITYMNEIMTGLKTLVNCEDDPGCFDIVETDSEFREEWDSEMKAVYSYINYSGDYLVPCGFMVDISAEISDDERNEDCKTVMDYMIYRCKTYDKKVHSIIDYRCEHIGLGYVMFRQIPKPPSIADKWEIKVDACDNVEHGALRKLAKLYMTDNIPSIYGREFQDLRERNRESVQKVSESVKELSTLVERKVRLDRNERVECTPVVELPIEEYKLAIAKQADEGLGWYEFDYEDDNKQKHHAKLPFAPFFNWCLYGGQFRANLLKPWDYVCPPDMKMPCDNRDHSDWYVGGGYDLDKCYKNWDKEADSIMNAAYDQKYKVQKEFLDYDLATLVRPKSQRYNGHITNIDKDNIPTTLKLDDSKSFIITVKSAGVEYDLLVRNLLKKGHVIILTEVGGRLCHLATVAREMNDKSDNQIGIFMKEDITNMFYDGKFVQIDVDNSKIL